MLRKSATKRYTGIEREWRNRRKARKARKEISSMKSQNEEYLEFKEPSEFIGYDTQFFESKIIKILKKDWS